MDDDEPDPLTPRQRECLEAREQHRSAKQIGRILGISHHTVFMHWQLARKRLSARRREQGDASHDQSGEPQPSSPVDPDVLLLLERLRAYARRFFFWVGILATAAFVIIHAGDGLLIMAGKKSADATERGCAATPAPPSSRPHSDQPTSRAIKRPRADAPAEARGRISEDTAKAGGVAPAR